MSLFSSSTSSAPPAKAQTPQPAAPAAQVQNPDEFTIDKVKESVPAHLRASVSQALVDKLNAVAKDPIMGEDIRNNFVSYSAILREGKFKIEEYLNAVAYVSYKIMGNSNQDAYAKTFPQRYAKLLAAGASTKDISSYVSAYNKGKLVNMILEQSLVPSWVLNQDLYQKAINVQADLMQNAASEKVRVEAANSLLTALQKPKDNNFQISIGEVENAGMKEMRDLLSELAVNQRNGIASGQMKTIEVASQRLVSDKDE